MSPAHSNRFRGSPDRRASAMTAASSARGPRGVHCVAEAHRGSSGARRAVVVVDIEGASALPRRTRAAPAAVRARVVAPAVRRVRRRMPVVRVATRAAGSGGSWVSRRRWSMAVLTSRSRRHGEGSRPSARCAASWAAVSRASRDAAWSVRVAGSVSRVARPRVVLCWSRWETASGSRSHTWSGGQEGALDRWCGADGVYEGGGDGVVGAVTCVAHRLVGHIRPRGRTRPGGGGGGGRGQRW
jgi:hypothetical protein